MVDPDTGILYVLTEEANLVSLTDIKKDTETTNEISQNNILRATTTLVADLGVGRPLGGAFVPKSARNKNKGNKDSKENNSVLYVADTLLGLIRVSNIQFPISTASIPIVELIHSSVVNKRTNERSRILYANDVDIGPITGHVYFTDSTTIAPERIRKNHNGDGSSWTFLWDTMMAYKRDYLRGEPTGRLLRYKPETNEIDVLLDKLWFANGVAVDENETFAMISETSQARQIKFDLTSIQENDDEPASTPKHQIMVDGLPGFPDGATCARTYFSKNKQKKLLCYVPMPSPELPITKLLEKLSISTSLFLRNILLKLPDSMINMIKPISYGGVVEIDPSMTCTDSENKRNTTYQCWKRLLQDPKGKDIGMLTGAAVHDGKLYLGSLQNDYVALYHLEE